MQIVLSESEFKKLQKKIKNLKAENSELKKKVQELISTLFFADYPLLVLWTVQFKSFEPSSLSPLNRPI